MHTQAFLLSAVRGVVTRGTELTWFRPEHAAAQCVRLSAPTIKWSLLPAISEGFLEVTQQAI